MKKYLKIIFFLILICLSFFYTKKTVSVVKDYDDIMIKIKEQQKEYEYEAQDATVDKNLIIPGLSGADININKSYSKMKRYGKYNSNLLVYEKIKPDISIENNKNKYIIKGNPKKNMISLVFIIENSKDLDRLLHILKNKHIKASLFIKNKLLEKSDTLRKLKEQKHDINPLDYNASNFAWINNKIKKSSNKNYGFCYLESTNNKILKKCMKYQNHTIIPSIKIEKNPLIEVKKNIKRGSIVSFKLNNKVLIELGLIIEYIKSKGYIIEPLSVHLEE